eukprot:TRINITY_DN83347_c0_g1_i1.p1 TRINITY_DN83347_c0_g1~~TRINITY_DN83347_c0_g1_i1.p1  ORF type:complete len:207 (-),score=6.27 TRINITY_DN83347_c0_g1_i1:24-644(-)
MECITEQLQSQQSDEVIIRALLIVRIISDKESERLQFQACGGVSHLVQLLNYRHIAEIVENAAAALGNLAAGCQSIKSAIREAGGIPPLVAIIKESPQEVCAELAAVVLRNLALQNPINRQAIIKEGGLEPLIGILSAGQDRLHPPRQCVVVYQSLKGTILKTKELYSVCAIDTSHGHLCIASHSAYGPFAALSGKSTNFTDGWDR